MTMEATERLAFLTAMKKAVEDEIKAARIECNAQLDYLYDEQQVEKRALFAGGVKVGEHSVTYEAEGYDVADRAALEEWALLNGFATEVTRVEMLDGWQRYLERRGGRVFVVGTDMEVPGVEYRPRRKSGTRVTGCKPSEVLPLLRGIDGGAQALLEGGTR